MTSQPRPTGRLTAVPAPLWEQQAGQWAAIGSPLRPAAEDMAAVRTAIDGRARDSGGKPLTVLVLGVTPELAGVMLPAGSRLLGADLSFPMVHHVWRGDRLAAGRRWATQANWLRLPLADASCDLVLGDGCFALLSGSEPDRLLRSVHRILRPGGLLLTRVFLAPDLAERPERVWDELCAGRIGNFHIFKLRLLASLRGTNGHVRVNEAWRFFHERCAQPEALSRQLGWPLAHMRTIEAYRDQPAVYWLPAIDEFRKRCTDCFVETACHFPRYELGERCPTFSLQRLA